MLYFLFYIYIYIYIRYNVLKKTKTQRTHSHEHFHALTKNLHCTCIQIHLHMFATLGFFRPLTSISSSFSHGQRKTVWMAEVYQNTGTGPLRPVSKKIPIRPWPDTARVFDQQFSAQIYPHKSFKRKSTTSPRSLAALIWLKNRTRLTKKKANPKINQPTAEKTIHINFEQTSASVLRPSFCIKKKKSHLTSKVKHRFGKTQLRHTSVFNFRFVFVF